MDLLNKEEIEKEIKKTIKGLVDREDTSSLKKWPNTRRTIYELEPKRRDSGLEGVTNTGILIGIAIGIGLIGIAIAFCIGRPRWRECCIFLRGAAFCLRLWCKLFQWTFSAILLYTREDECEQVTIGFIFVWMCSVVKQNHLPSTLKIKTAL